MDLRLAAVAVCAPASVSQDSCRIQELPFTLQSSRRTQVPRCCEAPLGSSLQVSTDHQALQDSGHRGGLRPRAASPRVQASGLTQALRTTVLSPGPPRWAADAQPPPAQAPWLPPAPSLHPHCTLTTPLLVPHGPSHHLKSSFILFSNQTPAAASIDLVPPAQGRASLCSLPCPPQP